MQQRLSIILLLNVLLFIAKNSLAADYATFYSPREFRLMGKGAYGFVLARHGSLEKVFKATLCQNVDDVMAAAIEATVISELTKRSVPNVVRKLNTQNAQAVWRHNELFIETHMKLLTPLRKDLTTSRPLAWCQDKIWLPQKWLYDIASALASLRRLELVHNDLKPENTARKIGTGNFSLLDFSSVGVENWIALFNGTTIWYAPPERLLGDLKVHSSCDIWALAVSYLELFVPGNYFFARLNSLENDQEDVQFQKLAEVLFPHLQKQKISSLEEFLSLVDPEDIAERIRQNFDFSLPYEAEIIIAMLHPDPQKRITAEGILTHPYFDNADFKKPIVTTTADPEFTTQIKHMLNARILHYEGIEKDFDGCTSTLLEQGDKSIDGFIQLHGWIMKSRLYNILRKKMVSDMIQPLDKDKDLVAPPAPPPTPCNSLIDLLRGA